MPVLRFTVFALILTITILSASTAVLAQQTIRITTGTEAGSLNNQTLYQPANLELALRAVIDPNNPPGTYQWTITGPYTFVTGSATSRIIGVQWTTRGNYTASVLYTGSSGNLSATVNVVVTDYNDEVELAPSHPCSQESQWPSTGLTFSTWIDFKNFTNQGLKYYWLNPMGQREPFGVFPANMPGISSYQPMWVGNNWVVTDENDVCLGIYTGIPQTGRASLINVTSVQFEKISPTVENISVNPNTGGGARIYPDRKNPSDAVDHRVRVKALSAYVPNKKIYFRSFDLDDPSTDDMVVDVDGSGPLDNRVATGESKAGLLSSPAGGGCTLDPNGSGLLGCPIDTSGVAAIDFTVSPHPGNNYAVAASLDPAYLVGLNANGTDLKDTSMATLPVPTGPTTPASLTRGARSQMLTVWRKLHIEEDTMTVVPAKNHISGIIKYVNILSSNVAELYLDFNAPDRRFQPGTIKIANYNGAGLTATFPVGTHVLNTTGGVYNGDFVTVTYTGNISAAVNKSYTIYDDDDFNGNINSGGALGDEGEQVTPLADTYSKIQNNNDNSAQNIFAPAYITVLRDGAGPPNNMNNNTDIPFALNIPNTPQSVNGQIGAGRDTAVGVESNDYWVAYVQIAYQGDVSRDYDPNFNDDPNDVRDIAGQTFGDFNNVIVNDELSVPAGGNGSLIYIETLRDYFLRNNANDRGLTVAHELGHQFGIEGHRDTDKVMRSSTTNVGTNEEMFIPEHLNMIRWRVKSPGQ